MEGRSRGRRVGTEDVEDYGRWLGMWEEGHDGAKDRKLEEEELYTSRVAYLITSN